MRKSRRILKDYAFSLTGAGSTNVNLNADDLTGVEGLVLEVDLTAAATDAGDLLDIRLQETKDGVTYNARARAEQFIGTMTVSTTAPEVRRQNILATTPLEVTEEDYETTGSAGATDLTAGAVRNGPFVGFYRTAAGRQPGMRLRFTVTDAGSVNAAFAGKVNIWALSSV